MKKLFIFANPLQAFTIQLMEDDSTVESKNCLYTDVINVVSQFQQQYDIQKYYIIGVKNFYQHIKTKLEEILAIEIEEMEFNNDKITD